jgi:hypothetical protein
VGGGGEGGFGWRLGVDIHLDGGVGWFIMVALSGSFLSLKYGGCQMLGINSRGYRVPDAEVHTKDAGQSYGRGNNNN